MRTLALATALALLCGPAATAQDGPQPAKLVLRASGIGKPADDSGLAKLRAKRAARVDAIRNLAAAIHGMIKDSEGTTWVQGAVKGFEVTEEKELADGSWRVTLELPVAQIVLQLHAQHAHSDELARELADEKKKNAELEARLLALRERFRALVASVREQMDAMRKLLDEASAGLGK